MIDVLAFQISIQYSSGGLEPPRKHSSRSPCPVPGQVPCVLILEILSLALLPIAIAVANFSNCALVSH